MSSPLRFPLLVSVLVLGLISCANSRSEPRQAAAPAPAEAGLAVKPAQAGKPAQSALPQEGQEAVGDEPAQAAPPVIVPPPSLTPAVPLPSSSIPDIERHRQRELSYVRRRADIVELDLPGVDVEADPVLVVGKRPISRAEFRRRAIMYMGSNQIDQAVMEILTRLEIERAVERGADAGEFLLSEGQIDAKVEEMMEMVRMQVAMQAAGGAPESMYRSPDNKIEQTPETEKAVADYKRSIETSIGMAAYRRMLAAQAEFERAYLPWPDGPVGGPVHDSTLGPPPMDQPRPEWIPEATWEAFGRDETGRSMRTYIATTAAEGSKIPTMFLAQIVNMIRDGLLKKEGVAFFFDEDMPAEYFLRVGDEALEVDEMWARVAPTIVDADLQLILREMLTLAGMRTALETAGRWLDPEACRQAWDAYAKEYEGSIFPVSIMVRFRGYDTVDRYREHYRYRHSYALWQKDLVTEEQILQHYQQGGRLFFESGSVAVDLAKAELGKAPFGTEQLDAARDRLAAALREARSQPGAEPLGPWWKDVAGEFPAPTQSVPGSKRDAFERNPLRIQLTESELSILVTGYSMADDIFYHGEAGAVFEPWVQRCRRHGFGGEVNAGAWAARVREFTRSKPLEPMEGRMRTLAEEDFIDLNFFHWAQESLRALLRDVKVPGR